MKALIVGHISLDHRENKVLLGGPPLYQIPILDGFGFKIDVLTSFNPESLDTKKLYPEVNFHNKISKYTTTFQFFKNINQKENDDDRKLMLIQKANDINLSDIEMLPDKYDVVIISPIASELSLEVISILANIGKISFFDIQGLSRKFKENGEVYQQINELEFNKILQNFDVIKASKSEVSNISEVGNPYESILIITDGGRKLDIHSNNEQKSITLEIVDKIKDDTGSGDIFLGTLAALYRKNNLIDAIQHAHEIAKLNLNIEGIPSSEDIKSQKKLLGIL